MSTVDFDVVIIGLGPSGGTLANLLAMNNLSILILEKEASIYNLPRAVHFDDEVMRVFNTIGITKSLKKKLIINKGTKFINEKGELLLDWPRPKVITENGWYPSYRFHQPDLERSLRHKLKRFEKVTISQNSEVYNTINHKNFSVLSSSFKAISHLLLFPTFLQYVAGLFELQYCIVLSGKFVFLVFKIRSMTAQRCSKPRCSISLFICFLRKELAPSQPITYLDFTEKICLVFIFLY